jgi:hypothetical protein
VGTLSPTSACEIFLPLGSYRALVWPVAKFSKLPTGLGLQNALERIFECFSSPLCISLCLAREDFVGHLGYSLVFVHQLPFPI